MSLGGLYFTEQWNIDLHQCRHVRTLVTGTSPVSTATKMIKCLNFELYFISLSTTWMQSFRLFFNYPNPVPNGAHARAMTKCCKQTATMLVSSRGRSLKNHQAMLKIENTPLIHSSKAFGTKLFKRQSWPYAST